MSAHTLRELARLLGGEVTAGQVIAPGPGHSQRDRSLSVKPCSTAPLRVVVFSFANDDVATCLAHVADRLGVEREPLGRWREMPRQVPQKAAEPADAERPASALSVWARASEPRGTLAERYLASRGLELPDELAGDVLRWHPGIGALLALFRSIQTGEPQAVSRTFLDREGRKLDRRFLGPVGGAAVMLDPFDAVLGGLHVAEGVETAMAARQLGLRPTWALGSCGAVAGFPVLSGIECLTLLAEHDEASAKATQACGARWAATGREVLVVHPTRGKDINDSWRGAP